MTGPGLVIFFSFWVLLILVCLAVPIVIGVLVYRDARRQEMPAPLGWALAAALVPSFIGLVVYLVVRSSNSERDA